MIKFIVVEDNKIHQKNVEDTIISFMMKNNYEFCIKLFDKETSELHKLIKTNEDNHIYILDFELPNSNAIDIARKIREDDWASPIIIFTAHGGMAFETFKQRLQILDFINKQLDPYKNLNEVFEICLKQLKVIKSFKFKTSGVDYNIPFNKILYFERDTYSRKIILVTDNNRYEMYKSMKEVKSKLTDDFIVTHRACIVNMKRIVKVSWKERKIYFDNGESTDLLSKTHKKEVDEYAKC